MAVRKASTQLVIIQPTPFCNIDCTYCYLPGREHTGRMSDATLDRIVDTLFAHDELASEITIVWHAGEPLVMPIDFYRRALLAFRGVNRNQRRLHHAIQTNGTLLTEAWCRLFSEFDIRVGVSIDGPAEMHDAFRIDRAGRGTHERVIAGINLLKKHNIPFGVIAVITAASVQAPDALWAYFIENNIHQIGLNIEEVEGVNHVSSFADRASATSAYRRFLARFLELWEQHAQRDRISVREITDTIGLISKSTDEPVASENTPLAIVSFDWQGNMSTFSPELLGHSDSRFPDFVFGNVYRNSIADIVHHARFKAVHAEIETGVQACRTTCEYFTLCGGGPPVNKLAENGTFASTETLYCAARVKATADIVLDYLDRRYGVH